jgi:flagellar FliJ protein
MRPFRFRAGAALEQRAREEDAAAAALARAEGRFSVLRDEWHGAVARQGEATSAADAAVRAGTASHAVLWHRNWIVSLAALAEARRQEMNRQEAAVAQARQAWFLARRKRLMLERLRDRALARHRGAERQAEMKEIDELARMRFQLAALDRSST